MKPDRIIFDETDKIRAIQEIPDESRKLIDSVTPYKGHTLFEIDCSTGNIKEAEYEEVNANYQTVAVRKKIIIKPNCLYISCLNKKSAKKKFISWLVQNQIQKLKATKAQP